MKLYVYNITKSEKMVYLSCVRNFKEGDKYRAVPYNVSIKKEQFAEAFNGKKIGFPFVIDCYLEKGKPPVLKLYGEKI